MDGTVHHRELSQNVVYLLQGTWGRGIQHSHVLGRTLWCFTVGDAYDTSRVSFLWQQVSLKEGYFFFSCRLDILSNAPILTLSLLPHVTLQMMEFSAQSCSHSSLCFWSAPRTRLLADCLSMRRVLTIDCQPISFERNKLWICAQRPEVRELKSDLAGCRFLGAYQKWAPDTRLSRAYKTNFTSICYNTYFVSLPACQQKRFKRKSTNLVSWPPCCRIRAK